MAQPDEDKSGAARAARLREKIERLRSGDKEGSKSSGTDEASAAGQSQVPLSPRDFIQKRMRELDKKR